MSKQGFLIMLISVMAYSCKTSQKFGPTAIASKQYMFPLDWIGHYKGELFLLGQKSDTVKVSMELIIDNPDGMGLYPWVLQYGENDVRYYGLEVLDATKGHYLIDEYNGIKLDAYLRSNHLITDFEVMDSKLTFHYERKLDGVAIQVYSSLANQYSMTGDEIIANDTIPPVKSFVVNGFQTGFLKQIK